MTDRYIDPNSGAAPQPGGYSAAAPVANPENPEEPARNVTMPDEANQPSTEPSTEQTQDQGVQELPEELQRSQSLDTEIQNQAAPQGPQPGAEDRDPVGPIGTSAGDPGLATNEEGSPLGADGEPIDAADESETQAEPATATAPEEPSTTPEAEPEPEPEDDDAKEPAGNASLEAWQEFARSKGATSEDLEGKKRDELRETYGS